MRLRLQTCRINQRCLPRTSIGSHRLCIEWRYFQIQYLHGRTLNRFGKYLIAATLDLSVAFTAETPGRRNFHCGRKSYLAPLESLES